MDERTPIASRAGSRSRRRCSRPGSMPARIGRQRDDRAPARRMPIMSSVSSPPRGRSPVTWQSIVYGLDPERFFASGQRRFGDVFSVRLLQETWTVVADPRVVKEVFVLGPMDANSGEANRELRPLLGTQN